MRPHPYIVFDKAKNRAINAVFAWASSLIGPLFVISEFGNYGEWLFYVGIGLTSIALASIAYGIQKFKRGIYSDFIIFSVFTVLPPVIFSILFVSSK